MIDQKLRKIVEECIQVRGRAAVENTLSSLLEGSRSSRNTLTIIANSGVHPIAEDFLKGEVYSASHGNFDVSSKQVIELEFHRILTALGRKLGERSWNEIYLIPTGHPALSAQIKLFVYRILRINTIDLFYTNGKYYELNIDHRDIVLKSPPTD